MKSAPTLFDSLPVAGDKSVMLSVENLITQSPINVKKLSGQNKRLLDYLMTGNSIHVFSDAKRELRIGYLNSRCSDLINVHKIDIQKRYIEVKDFDGNDTSVVEYSMSPEEIKRISALHGKEGGGE